MNLVAGCVFGAIVGGFIAVKIELRQPPPVARGARRGPTPHNPPS